MSNEKILLPQTLQRLQSDETVKIDRDEVTTKDVVGDYAMHK
jgi:hypothetical protein